MYQFALMKENVHRSALL